MTDEERCQFCPNSREAHKGLHHPFSPVGQEVSLDFLGKGKKKDDKDKRSPAAAPATVGRGLGGDPALRLALINAGVITPAQLFAAEQELEDARSSGRPAVSQAPAGGDSEGDLPDAGFGLGPSVRPGHGGGS